MAGLSKRQREQERAEAAWIRFQQRQRRPPVEPPRAVLVNEPHPEQEPLETERLLDPRLHVPLSQAEAVREWEERQEGIRPGSLAEQEILARMDARREEEIERDRRPRGMLRKAELVSQRIRGGKLVGIYRTGRNRWAEVEL